MVYQNSSKSRQITFVRILVTKQFQKESDGTLRSGELCSQNSSCDIQFQSVLLQSREITLLCNFKEIIVGLLACLFIYFQSNIFRFPRKRFFVFLSTISCFLSFLPRARANKKNSFSFRIKQFDSNEENGFGNVNRMQSSSQRETEC